MTKSPKILIADGNTKDRNDAMTAVGGELGAALYANEIRRMFPDAELVTVYPADKDDYLPKGVGLADFDGMVMGGSGLHAFDKDPEHVYSPPSTSGGESSASSQGLETV